LKRLIPLYFSTHKINPGSMPTARLIYTADLSTINKGGTERIETSKTQIRNDGNMTNAWLGSLSLCLQFFLHIRSL
jgi:hypothetical protein